MRARLVGWAVLAAAMLAAPEAAWCSSSTDELLRLARAHERAREEDVAVRRYMEALSLDATCEEAYLGLGALRTRLGDLREAERVYSVALERRPRLDEARLARAHVRRALGLRVDAIADALAGREDDPVRLRMVAGWYAEDGHTPAQLAVWRRIATLAERSGDPAFRTEARAMVRALVLLVGSADPVAAPADNQGVRAMLGSFARRP